MSIIDPTITVGNIIEAAAFIGGGVLILNKKLFSIENIKIQLDSMQDEIKKLASIITAVAVQDNRLTNVEADIRELKHGHGFVRGVNGEYMAGGKVKQQSPREE